jgi:lipopolysaccharide biosynthesis regulator YciM
MTAKNWTTEPWQHILGHDTHKVKRDKAGRMLGPVTMDLDDYDRACECVNACEGINPEAVPEIVKALEEADEQLVWLLRDVVQCDDNETHDDVGKTRERIRAALAKARGEA